MDGRARTEDEILDITEEWHDGVYPMGVHLYDALGWTYEEYKIWLETSEVPG